MVFERGPDILHTNFGENKPYKSTFISILCGENGPLFQKGTRMTSKWRRKTT